MVAQRPIGAIAWTFARANLAVAGPDRATASLVGDFPRPGAVWAMPTRTRSVDHGLAVASQNFVRLQRHFGCWGSFLTKNCESIIGVGKLHELETSSESDEMENS